MKSLSLTILALCLMPFGLLAETTEERLAKLEKLVQEQAVIIQALQEKLEMTTEKVDPTAKSVKTGYKKGFLIANDDFSLKIGGRVQVRYTYEDPDYGSASDKFTVQRARLKFSGHAWHPNLTYALQVDMGKGKVSIKDAYVNWKWRDEGQLRAGLFKAPFSRQEITSSSKQQFVDRSFLIKKFAPGRDTGIMLHGKGAQGKFEYDLGVWNSDVADTTDHLWSARAAFNPIGKMAYSESATAHRDGLDLGVGLAYWSDSGSDDEGLEFDIAAHYLGWSMTGEYFDGEKSGLDHDGWYLQTGIFIVPKTLEFALRYGDYDPDSSVTGDDMSEFQFAVNYFWNKHKNKIQLDWTQHDDDLTGEQEDMIRLQYQLAF